ncbi:PTS ascorbate transporter subunit IIC [Tepidanaerobacter syntrophicus]|uniref:PTS ascorbate transporter subunit IIC n=1 Tax=Tepidanaerobacter syntrophicus TaxID=224999 RepID=UPI0022EE7110|nr:PTS ascorbate transporter subunit IIC [Tepidanaerobacter syntrophicus]GLI50704.1 PTS ascorbate transporter subunit IIC [Tepidanaerobacter syntrophicus]
MDVIFWIATNILGQPAILIGLIVLLGLVLQKKSFSQIMTGTFKAIIGFMIINGGSGIIVNALNVFQPMWQEVFGLKAQELGQFMGQPAFSQQFGSAVTLSMVLGFLINVFLAKFTKWNYIYLTGHMMFWTAMIFAGIVVNTVGTAVSMWKLILFLSVFLGLYWTIQPALTQPFMRKITGGDQIALGHTSASVSLIGAWLGKIFGNKQQDSESLKLPKGLEFLRDSNVIIALIMSALYLIGALIILAKPETPSIIELKALAGDQNFAIFSLIQGFQFAGGIAVVLFGVRMLIGEIVPAFKGIADTIVPNAKPALDCPIVYPYAPTASILGFLGCFVGTLIWLVVLGRTTGYVFVPTMIALFFHSATAGVFGNSTGGIRGALIAGFVTSTVIAWGQYFTVTFLINSTIPDTAMWAGDSDMFILGPLVALLSKLIF